MGSLYLACDPLKNHFRGFSPAAAGRQSRITNESRTADLCVTNLEDAMHQHASVS